MRMEPDAAEIEWRGQAHSPVHAELWRCGHYFDSSSAREEMEGSFNHAAVAGSHPMQHLDHAVANLARGNWRVAVAEYAVAMRIADSLDERELDREQEWLRRRIAVEPDQVSRHYMIERDQEIYLLRRAPGVTRANFGLLLVRMGHLAEGFNLISYAMRLDPETQGDPSFRRHLFAAIDQSAGSGVGRGAWIMPESRVYAKDWPAFPGPSQHQQAVRAPAPGSADVPGASARRHEETSSGLAQTRQNWRADWNFVPEGAFGPSVRDRSEGGRTGQSRDGDGKLSSPSGSAVSPQERSESGQMPPSNDRNRNYVSPLVAGAVTGVSRERGAEPNRSEGSKPADTQGQAAGQPVWKPKELPRMPSANPWQQAQGKTSSDRGDALANTEAAIDRSLGRIPGKFDFELRAVLGGLGATFAGGPLHWLANKAADWQLSRSSEGAAARAARAWQKHFDLRQEAAGKLAGAEQAVRSAQVGLDNVVQGIGNRLATMPGGSAEASQLALRQRILSSPLESAASIKRAQLLGTITAEDLAVINAREQAIARATTAEATLASASRFGGAGFAKNFGKGLALAGTVQIADHLADKHLFGKDHASRPSWYTASLLLPLSFIVPKTWKGRTGAVAASTVGGWLVDRFVPPDRNSEYGKLLRPRCDESFLMGVALMFPLRRETVLARSLLVGGVWVAGRIANAFQEPSKKEIFDSLAQRIDADRKQRTAASMNEAIDGIKSYAKSSRQANAKVTLETERSVAAIQEGNPSDEANARRQSAIYLAARGEARLDQGTFMGLLQGRPTSSAASRALSTADESHQYDFILAGYGLDIGLQALPNLTRARQEINEAIRLTRAQAGRSDVGSEVEGLESAGKRIDKSIERIFGRHDIRKIYEELQQAERVNLAVMTKFGLQMAKMADQPMKSDDHRASAKLCRDAALLQLAFAGFKAGHNGVGNGRDAEGAATVHAVAARYLQKAQKLDPQHPDNGELLAIADELDKLIQERKRPKQDSFAGLLSVDSRSGKSGA